MTLEHTLQKEIDESKKWLDRENDESVYKRDLEKRIELINWVLENMKNPGVEICGLIESKINEIILAINQTYSILEADKLHSELQILIGYCIKFALMKNKICGSIRNAMMDSVNFYKLRLL
ncbi:MAG: hypothetical protein E6L04_03060 [Thaumarchaeota archaeon]|nr:MAG: hypothetical protein E6L04_03060 [Nitrososphaerota archaeon]